MRIHHTPRPRVGQYRLRTRFLYLPVHLNNETRWWEWATYQECYCIYGYWYKTRWADPHEHLTGDSCEVGI